MVRFHLFVATVICFATNSLAAQPSDREAIHAEPPLVAPPPLQLWVEQLNHSDPDVQKGAVRSLNQEAECPDWFDLFNDSDSVRRAAMFRSRMKPFLPMLVQHLRNCDLSSDDWQNADSPFMTVISILMAMGTDAEMAISELRTIALNTAKPSGARANCVMALFYVVPEETPVGPLLLNLLDSMPAEMQAELQEGARQLQDGEWSARTSLGFGWTFYSMYLIYSGHTKCEVPTLVKIAGDEYPLMLRAIAIGVLGELSFDARSAVPELRKLLNDEDPFIRELAVRVISTIQDDETLIPELLPFLKLDVAKSKEVEQDLKEYFEENRQKHAKWRNSPPDHWDAWLIQGAKSVLQHGNGYQRRQTIQDLGHMGPNAKDVLPELRRFLNDRDEDTRRMAAEAIRQIEAE